MELSTNDLVTVDTTAVVISVEKANANTVRKSIIVINSSAGGQVVTLGIDKEAVANYGIVLSPGGYWSDSAEGGYYPTQKQITAIADIAGAKLSIQERTER